MELTPEICRALVDPRWIGRRVAVAMSGGVDSSVAAVILSRAGCEVIGVTMKLWDYAAVGGDGARDGQCCTVEAFTNCRTVAGQSGFPHYTIDFTGQFERDVIGCFVSEYRAGRTPNPCILCNSKLKWPALWEKVSAFGCKAIATGHYARLEQADGGDVVLARAVDPDRDQSYFLWAVPAEFLARTIFPLGTLHKSQVRDMARSLGLVNAETPESRDICFVADGDLGRFMRERAEIDGVSQTPGPILNREGIQIGRHNGFESVTIGQRRGLGVAVGRPQYVTAIDPATGTVVLGDDSDLHHRLCTISHVNWLVPRLRLPERVLVQIRYLHEAAPACLTAHDDDSIEVRFETPQRAITPGQSAVLYNVDRVIAGGIIQMAGPE